MRTLTCLLLLLTGACTMGEGGPDVGFDGGLSYDGGPAADSAVMDAFPPPGREGIPADPGAFTPSASEYDGAARNDIGSCFDGIDNDEAAADGIDCEDPGCIELRSCCVGDGDCCDPVDTPPLPASITAEGCTDDTTAATCLIATGLAVRSFGDPVPWVRDGRIYPGGDDSFDSGLVIGEPVDLTTHRVAVSTSFTHAEDCGVSCLEGAAVGLTTQEPGSDGVNARPLVAMLYSGSRQDVTLVLGGEVAASWPALVGVDSEEWRMVVRPTGEVTVERVGDTPAGVTARFRPSRVARLIIYGRNRNETPVPNAGLGPISVETSLCDIPDAWADRAPLSLVDETMAPFDASFLGSPSLAASPGGDRFLAFTEPGPAGLQVRLATRAAGSDGPFVVFGDPASMLGPGGVYAAAGVDDPELVWDDEASELRLYYTGIDATGVASIGMATVAPDTGEVSSVDRPLLDPAALGVQGLDDPAVLHHPLTWILIARATQADGRTQLMPFVSDDGFLFEPFVGSDLGDRLDPLQGSDRWPGFDPDEVAAPSLVVHDGAYQLYYARRRGTRWSVGVVVSDELLFWRHIGDGAQILSGGQSGFDRLGVAEPDVLAEGSTLSLVYAGLDGATSWPGIITREAAVYGSR